MKQFTMSMYASAEDLYKAKAEHYKRLFDWLTAEVWKDGSASGDFDGVFESLEEMRDSLEDEEMKRRVESEKTQY